MSDRRRRHRRRIPSDTSEAIEAIAALDNSYIFVQGPPGAGKTYTGSHVIVELITRGFRVGVASNSHKAINNLLKAIEEQAGKVGSSISWCEKMHER
jgi:uncharacterized protein